MTDDRRPQRPDPAAAPCQVDAATPSPGACDWSDGANWANLLIRTTGTVPAASDYASFQDEVHYQGETIDTTRAVG